MAAAKKILKLDAFAIQDDFFADVALIGMTSDKPVYTLCHMFNKTFDLSFSRQRAMDVTVGKQDEIYSFPVYQSAVPRSECRYTIYKLKVDNVLLLPGLKNMDYIWMISSEEPELTALEYLQQLKQMKEVQFATLLEIDKIKNVEYLIL